MSHHPLNNAFVYIMTNEYRTVFYIGVTNDLERRVREHRSGEGVFTHRYQLKRLVYFEECSSIVLAISREKQLKNWQRAWKLELIKSKNPNMEDLAKDWE